MPQIDRDAASQAEPLEETPNEPDSASSEVSLHHPNYFSKNHSFVKSRIIAMVLLIFFSLLHP
jgi:hypothetical protein